MLGNLDNNQRHPPLDAYNGVMRSGCLLDHWRHTINVPLLKRGKPPRDIISYRWIAQTSAALPPEQCGFRAHHSTADCLAVVGGTLEQARLDGEAAFLLLLDMQAAFDSLPHETFLASVHAFGVVD
ncbi:uncharacterized protein LOC142559342 [Dermacentor variabilis]|uniref:uncharacterized protein LOC142559342 n=1 Tax=Dermacentor variabilis TaxID=34621 RepID=UPI003F5C9F75